MPTGWTIPGFPDAELIGEVEVYHAGGRLYFEGVFTTNTIQREGVRGGAEVFTFVMLTVRVRGYFADGGFVIHAFIVQETHTQMGAGTIGLKADERIYATTHERVDRGPGNRPLIEQQPDA
jgi:hypothetical protein